MKKLMVSTQTIKDVRGKQLLYLIIGEGDQKIIMNIGLKTFDGVNKLLGVNPLPSETDKTPKNASEMDKQK